MKYLASLLLLAACGSKAAPSTTTTQSTDTAVVTLPDVPFDKLDHEQREEFMKQKVMPVMEPIFKNHDPKKYAEFGCKTCHSDDGHHDMPNAELPKLNFKDMSKWKKEDLEWMGKEVKPAMAKILSLPESTQENPKGFGCPACHTLE